MGNEVVKRAAAVLESMAGWSGGRFLNPWKLFLRQATRGADSGARLGCGPRSAGVGLSGMRCCGCRRGRRCGSWPWWSGRRTGRRRSARSAWSDCCRCAVGGEVAWRSECDVIGMRGVRRNDEARGSGLGWSGLSEGVATGRGGVATTCGARVSQPQDDARYSCGGLRRWVTC